MKRVAALVGGLMLTVAGTASAGPITIVVGDNDGYGIGLADGANLPPSWSAPYQDTRSPEELAATNGAQFTDVYSAFYPNFVEYDCVPVCSTNGQVGAVLFPFSGQLTAATLTIDMAGFQNSLWAPIAADVNGVSLPFWFDDGWMATSVRTFTLTPTMLDAANLSGSVILNLDHTGSYDYIAFDYFQLDAEVVPEPTTLLLIGTGLGIAGLRRLRKRT